MFFHPGRDVGVCLGIDVGVDPQRDRGLYLHPAGLSVDGPQFVFRFHIEHEDPVFESEPNLRLCLPHSGVDYLPGRNACLQGTVQFTSGYYVGPASAFGQEPEDRAAGVGLQCVTDDMREPAEGVVIGLEVADQRSVTVNVEGSPVFFGQCADGYVLCVKFPAPVFKKMHIQSPALIKSINFIYITSRVS